MHLQEGTLVPMASTGLAPDLMGRRFDPAAHARLSAILEASNPVRFPADCELPDPFDGLMTVDAEGKKRVPAWAEASMSIANWSAFSPSTRWMSMPSTICRIRPSALSPLWRRRPCAMSR